MRNLVFQYLSKNRGVGRRRRAKKQNVAQAKNIQKSSCSLSDSKNGTAKVTIDMSYTPSSELQRVQMHSMFADDEFQRLSAFYQFYKIDIVNCMFFSNTANGQIFVNYAAPNDNVISVDNDFSRVISYPMYKIKNVLFTQIKTRMNTGDGVFNFQGWNSTQIIPTNIGDLIIYNRNQITINLKVRYVVRFKGYKGESVLPKEDIKILQPDLMFVNAETQTDPVVLEPKKVAIKEEPKRVETNKPKTAQDYVTEAVRDIMEHQRKIKQEELDKYKNGEKKFEQYLNEYNALFSDFQEFVNKNLEKVYETNKEFEDSELFKKHQATIDLFNKLDEYSYYANLKANVAVQQQTVAKLRLKLSKYRFFDLSCKLYCKPCKVKDFVNT